MASGCGLRMPPAHVSNAAAPSCNCLHMQLCRRPWQERRRRRPSQNHGLHVHAAAEGVAAGVADLRSQPRGCGHDGDPVRAARPSRAIRRHRHRRAGREADHGPDDADAEPASAGAAGLRAIEARSPRQALAVPASDASGRAAFETAKPAWVRAQRHIEQALGGSEAAGAQRRARPRAREVGRRETGPNSPCQSRSLRRRKFSRATQKRG